MAGTNPKAQPVANRARANTLKKKRTAIRETLWPGERAWLSEDEKGFFMVPRTLPLIMQLLAKKKVSGDKSPTSAYLELLSRNMGEGYVENVIEEEHASAAGYNGTQAKRTWRDRLRILEKLGFIKVKAAGGRDFAYVLLVHPTIAVAEFRRNNPEMVDEEWWDTYRTYQVKVGEPQSEDLVPEASDPPPSAASGS